MPAHLIDLEASHGVITEISAEGNSESRIRFVDFDPLSLAAGRSHLSGHAVSAVEVHSALRYLSLRNDK